VFFLLLFIYCGRKLLLVPDTRAFSAFMFWWLGPPVRGELTQRHRRCKSVSKALWWDGARGSLVIKLLGCKPEGRGFETRSGEILNVPNPSGRTRPWGLLSL
jgi:hypothetical protein